MLCYVTCMLCYAMLCYVMLLCYVISCHVMLCYVIMLCMKSQQREWPLNMGEGDGSLENIYRIVRGLPNKIARKKGVSKQLVIFSKLKRAMYGVELNVLVPTAPFLHFCHNYTRKLLLL